MVGGRPLDLGPGGNDRGAGETAPESGAGIVKETAVVDFCQTPVETGLMLVMTGAEFGEDAFAVGRNDRVKVGAKFGTGVLSEDGLLLALAENGDGFGDGVLAQGQVGGEAGGERAGGERDEKTEAKAELHGNGCRGTGR